MSTIQKDRPREFAHPSRSSGGFTLIELLVVIAVIGVLAAFLGVAVMGVANKARVENTRALLNRVASGLSTYFSRYNAYPPTDLPGSAYAGSVPNTPAVPGGSRGLAYERSKNLHFYLGALLCSFEGFRPGAGAPIPTVRKINEPLANWKLADLDGNEAGKVTQFEPPQPLPANNGAITYTPPPAANLRRIIDAFGNPIGYRGRDPNLPTPLPIAFQPTQFAQNHSASAPGGVAHRKFQYQNGPILETSTADNRTTFDLWSLGADGQGGPQGPDAPGGEPNLVTPTLSAVTGGPVPQKTQLFISDDLTNWFSN
ncbi:MAG: prepilin-type N-terminal cleavage/methylation domain-containing protein [Planctomycetes bacterium]|nr:prepilin-type N-terminal cleavage/methylation domain-containing protein [Planctomycetota bacterium]